MGVKGNRGFTLIEVIVVAGIIAILAGILVPLIFKEIDEARITRAVADTKSISTAMMVFRKDTGQWPVMDATCSPDSVTLLAGLGLMPGNLAAKGFNATTVATYNDYLQADTNSCYNNWKGPYMATVSADPWGNAYVTNADAFYNGMVQVWVISAGPNGVMDTVASSNVVTGDDVGIRLK